MTVRMPRWPGVSVYVAFAVQIALAAQPRMDSAQGRPPAQEYSEDAARLGERFYRLGTGVAGEPVAATVQGDLTVRSTEMPCVNCHRRSGFGSAEGPLTVRSITGDVLFRPVTVGRPEMGAIRTTGPGTRPAYDERALMRALRDGLDPVGRPLSPTMPRYQVSEADVGALSRYLRLLSAGLLPGVTDSQIHLATIVAPGVSAGSRDSMLDVLRAYVRAKNAGTRNETRRRERGPWDMKEHYEIYRQWVLHEWVLDGAHSEWPAQLAELYRRQPVFALVSGIADGDWAPIHEFSERFHVPAVLPQTPLPPAVEPHDGFYSLYFSRGLTLEAETLAQHLKTTAPNARVLQVSRCGAVGQTASATLARRIASFATIESTCVEPAAALTDAVWQGLLRRDADTLVLWLGPGDLRVLGALAAGSDSLAGVNDVYVSSSLLGEERDRLPGALASRALLLHPFVLPGEFEQHAWRALTWLKASRINAADRQVAVNSLLAATLVAEALSHPRTLTSREYFVERIEHMAARSPNPSAYPAVSFGPDRRFASSGCYIVKVPSAPAERFRKVGTWIVPAL